MKRLYSILFATLLAVAVMAVPAMRFTRQVQQPDGTSLTIKLVGDEFFSYYATLDGIPVVEQQTGGYVYARCKEGRFEATTKLAHDAQLRDVSEQMLTAGIKSLPIEMGEEAKAIRRGVNEETMSRAAGPNRAPNRVRHTGNKQGLIILVQYPDQPMVHTQEEFDEQINESGYNKNGHIGSLSDFFHDQSYGQLSVDFDVVGPYTVSHNLAYYGAHTESSNDCKQGELISEAVHLAHADGVDYSRYDWNGDGYVDQVFVIYAGYAEAQGGAPETIWPHKWSLYAAYYYGRGGKGTIQYDGKYIDTYACSSELFGYRGTKLAGIGTAAHEFSHCFGLPDFYDTRNVPEDQLAPGMLGWSLMDSGCYKQNSDVPTGYTAYERWYCGWMDLKELDDPCHVNGMKHLVDTPEAYIIYNQKNRNEYYILENHQPNATVSNYRNWDAGLEGHGMLVLHADYSSTRWSGNTVNTDPARQRMTFVPADNKIAYSAATLYPGTRKNTSLTNDTQPAATLYSANTDGAKFLSRPIENIREENGLISFKFNGGTRIEVPDMGDPSNVTATGFMAHWTEVDNATSYTLQLKEKGANDQLLLINQDFTTNPALTSEGRFDAAADVATIMGEEGWTAKRIYTGVNRLCISSSTQTGYLQSPLYNAPYDGVVTVNVGYQRYKTNTSALKVQLVDEAGNNMAEAVIDPTIKDGVDRLIFTDVNQNFRVNITTSGKQVYLTSLNCLTAVEPIQVEGVKQTSYTFDGLTPGTEYCVRVRAYVGEDFSQWSDYMDVKLNGETAIDAVAGDEQHAHDLIFNLSGQRVGRAQKGIHIVGDKKVLVK